jgi:hypothetical protein
MCVAHYQEDDDVAQAVAPTIKDRSQLPDTAKGVVDLVERLGVRWEFDHSYPTPDVTRRVQIRATKHYAPNAQVSQYAAAMRNGDQFAPVVVTRDGYLIDGNTRSEAARKNKFPTVHAIVLTNSWEGASDAVQQRLRTLGAGFNVRNGRGIDRAEIADAIRAISANEDYTASRIATLLGTTTSTVQGVIAEEKARSRAARLHIKLNGSVSTSQLRRLGQAPGLHDRPFAELARLVQDAGLTSTEMSELLKQIKAAPDDDAAVALIAEQREARAEQIANYRASGKARPPASALLRQRLGYVLAAENDPASLVEHNVSLVETHSDAIRRAIRVLDAVLAIQSGS